MRSHGGEEITPMRISIEARARNGTLHEAAKALGSSRALAEALGVRYHALCGWMTMRNAPARVLLDARWAEWEITLSQLCGRVVVMSDVFPEVLRDKVWLEQPKTAEKIFDIDPAILLSGRAWARLPAASLSPDEALDEKELRNLLHQEIEVLTPREKEVVTARFGFESEPQTFDEIAGRLDLSRERIRQIESAAFQKLRFRLPRRLRGFRLFYSELRETPMG
jgi:RNA polymerase sigma factor (sigma-70 family)